MNADEFTARYQAAYPKLSVIAKAIALRPSDADDLLQASIVIALEKPTEVDSDIGFCRWMSAILRNVASNYRRKTYRHKESTGQIDFGSVDPAYQSVETTVDFDEVTRSFDGLQDAFDDKLQSAISRLQEVSRICLLLRSVLELSYAEISQLLNLPEGTIASHVSRAKQALRNELSQDGGKAGEQQ